MSRGIKKRVQKKNPPPPPPPSKTRILGFHSQNLCHLISERSRDLFRKPSRSPSMLSHLQYHYGISTTRITTARHPTIFVCSAAALLRKLCLRYLYTPLTCVGVTCVAGRQRRAALASRKEVPTTIQLHTGSADFL